jgi:hypothetical protein
MLTAAGSLAADVTRSKVLYSKSTPLLYLVTFITMLKIPSHAVSS